MGESNTPLVDGLFPICTKDVFDAYHDPSVHIFLSIVFGIFGLVFLYYAIARRPRFEYFLLFAVCALQVGAFILRIYSDITDAFIALMVYSAGCSSWRDVQHAGSMDLDCRQVLWQAGV